MWARLIDPEERAPPQRGQRHAHAVRQHLRLPLRLLLHQSITCNLSQHHQSHQAT